VEEQDEVEEEDAGVDGAVAPPASAAAARAAADLPQPPSPQPLQFTRTTAATTMHVQPQPSLHAVAEVVGAVAVLV
jgi:hypothetical protein